MQKIDRVTKKPPSWKNISLAISVKIIEKTGIREIKKETET